MVAGEDRQRKGLVLLEHQETVEELERLKKEAHEMAQLLRCVAEWLAANSNFPHGNEIYVPEHGPVNLEKDGRFARAMDFSRALVLVKKIKEVTDRLADVERRKAALGV